MIQRYEVVLTTQSPVHIGCGTKLSKKEYVYYWNSNQVKIIDLVKFFRFLDEKKLVDDYQLFAADSYQSLGKWFKEKKVNLNQVENLTAYTVKNHANSEDDEKEIHMFLKDVYGNPYIPGSSLKGALRTAILSGLVKNRSQELFSAQKFRGNFKVSKKYRKKEMNKSSQWIENRVLNTLQLKNRKGNWINHSNALTSILRGISISDSAPIDKSRLAICPKIDYSIQQNPSKVMLLRECIVPWTEVRFYMSLDPVYLSKAGVDIEFLQKSIQSFYTLQRDCWLSKFPSWKENGEPHCRLFLGGGTGFQSKTITQSLYGDQALNLISELLQNRFNEHKHNLDVGQGVSPRKLKCTQYDGETYLMGECEVAFRCLSE